MNTYFHTPSIFVRLGKQEHKHFSSKLKTTCRTKKTRKIALVGLKKNCFLQNKYSTAVLVHWISSIYHLWFDSWRSCAIRQQKQKQAPGHLITFFLNNLVMQGRQFDSLKSDKSSISKTKPVLTSSVFNYIELCPALMGAIISSRLNLRPICILEPSKKNPQTEKRSCFSFLPQPGQTPVD